MIMLSRKSIRSVIVSGLSFILLFFIAYRYTDYKRGQWEKDVRNDVLESLIGKKSRLEQALYSRIYYTKGVASYVSLNPSISNTEFDLLATDLIKGDTIISSMALAKDCIIGAIFPLEGHEAALGLDLLGHPERVEIVDKTIETRKTFVAGPVELIEGGVAFISYTPIFDKTKMVDGEFWGVTDIVILMDALLCEAGLKTVENEFEFALRGYNGRGADGAVFFGDADIFNDNPVSIAISLPYGNWELASKPLTGWESYYDQDKFMIVALMLSSFIISILIGGVFHGLYKVRTSERKLKAIFESLDSLIIEFNSKGVYQNIASVKHDLLIRPSHILLGKSIHDFLDKETAYDTQKAIEQCIRTKQLVVIEYPLLINGDEKWFQGRVSFKNDDSVIFNAIDMTSAKESQESLKRSELQLKESNAMKDKLFSVLAHDLRNPLSSFMQMTAMLVDSYDDFTEEDLKHRLNIIKSSSNDVYNLLERLLEWQVVQQQSNKMQLERANLKSLCDDVLSLQFFADNIKNIVIKNNILDNTLVLCNEQLTLTIFRNLISNAIKFSFENSQVNVYSKIERVHDKEFVVVDIVDDGVGMRNDKLTLLNETGVVGSSFGTNKEKGAGLGLVLCREFIEMQGGTLKASSVEGKGSTFTFTLLV